MTTSTTSRFALTTWSSDSDAPTVSQFASNNSTLDASISICYADTLANIVNYQGFPGVKFLATDKGTFYRHNGATWVPILTTVDTEVLSTALPAPSQDGLYYHCTDTGQIYRDTGTALVEILTGLAAAVPVGTLAYYPVNGAFVANKFFVDPADSPPSLPSGWAYCAGQSLAVASYGPLFAAIGYSYTVTGWQLTVSGVSGSQAFSGFPTLSEVQAAISQLGVTPQVDSYNPGIVASPAFSISATGTASSGPTFDLPIGVARPMYSYSQSSYEAQEVANQGLPVPLGWAAGPVPANPYLTDGCPTGCFAIVIKTT